MISLLLKDFYLIRKRGILIPLLALFFAAFVALQANFLYLVMSTLMLLMLTLSTMAYDQSDGFDAFSLALPLSKQEIVIEKYLLGLCAMGISVVAVILFTVIFNRKISHIVDYIALQCTFGFLFMAINYPLIFKYGFEKSRVCYIVISMALAGIGGALVQLGILATANPSLLIIAIFSLLLCFVSYRITIRILKSKEFTEN